MYSNKDAANPGYPTQWALNPTAYQNVDCSEVDWAALAQQWIAMKEAAAIVAPAPPPPKLDVEEGEAPMEVENTENNTDVQLPPGWGWPGHGDPKVPSEPTLPLIDGFPMQPDATGPSISGYTTAAGSGPTFQHGYWTAPQADQQTSNRSNSQNRDRRSKSKNKEHNKTRIPRPQRDKPGINPVIPPAMPGIGMPTIDAAKRRQLPAWIREGLEKMEREKQRAIEREQEKKAREEAEKEKKRLEEEELERMKAAASGQPVPPPKSKFESDSETEEMEPDTKEEPSASTPIKEERGEIRREENEKIRDVPSPLIKKSKDEIMQEVMLAVRRSLTEILLEVTDQEIETVSQEELARYTATQASRINAMKAGKSKALAAIASGLGLGAYESSSGESDDENQNDISDQQLQEMIRRKKIEFERTAREIEAEVRRAERDGDGVSTPIHNTPERPTKSERRSSATPPLDSETPEKILDRRLSKDKKSVHKSSDKVDGIKKLDPILEERSRRNSKREHTPSPQHKNNYKSNDKESTSSSSDSDDDSSSSSSDSSESEPEPKRSKKRKRRSSSSSHSRKKYKKERTRKDKYKSHDRHYKNDEYDRYSSKKKDVYQEKHKSSRSSKDYDRQRYRDGSEEERGRKRAKRSPSPRRRDHDKYDRYERSRDPRRSRSTSYSRHRR
ncbi:arginine/serine-rich protein PNISR isoform X2 [Bombyx mandarina]|uniref:Arginine/serine-rich protein PNISR isoform X2 n=1 Tax=Bombyx mandarina TaxID=7092 RepID=A0A6J2KMF8_BOMMA|nr:arginine/serine-rich protein PNISR isoform X2 [Bombyx mandarina]